MDGPGAGGNGTEAQLPVCKDHDQMHRLHLVWNSLVFLLGLGLNGTALYIFLRYFKFTNKTVVYMVNLAVCDLLFTLALPLRLYYYAADAWPFGDVPCQIAGALFQVNMYGSCLFLAAINVDRFLALVYPLRFRHLRRPKVARRACVAIWGVIALGCVPVALAHDTSRCRADGGRGSDETRCFESFSRAAWRGEILPLVALQFSLGFLLPLGTVLYCSARVLRALSPGDAGGVTAPWKRSKTVRLLSVNVVIFVVCFLPYNVTLLLYTVLKVGAAGGGPGSPGLRASTRLALQFALLLASSNCCLDPLVYYFSTEGFRNTIRARRAVRSQETKQHWVSGRSRRSRGVKGRRGQEGPGPATDEMLQPEPQGPEGVEEAEGSPTSG